MNLKAMVEDIRENVFDINNGGCSSFALILSERLTLLNISYRIILIDDHKVCRLKDDDACNHVLIKVGRYYVDGYNVSLTKRDWGRKMYVWEKRDKRFEKKKLRYFWGYATLDRLRAMVENGPWCDDYIKSQNETIKIIVNKHIC